MNIYLTLFCIVAVSFLPSDYCQNSEEDDNFVKVYKISEDDKCTPGKQFFVHPKENLCMICVCNADGNGNVDPEIQPCTKYDCDTHPNINPEDDPYAIPANILAILQTDGIID